MTTLKIGTRGSALAMYQTNLVADQLRSIYADTQTPLTIEIVEITTSGDWKPSHGETRLSEAKGGKGLFAKEIEQALLDGAIDCAVHSMKDMPSFLPEGLVLDCVLPRADERDAIILGEELRGKVTSLADLPKNAVVGTSSTRRASYILHHRPDIKIVPLRGNVPTRIEKVRVQKMADATVLACAGLARLEREADIDFILDPESDMMPAVCQGVICIEAREDDAATRKLLAPLNCATTDVCASAERGALQALDGSCQTPIGVRSHYEGDTLRLDVSVLALDGSAIYEHGLTADELTTPEAAAEFGFYVGSQLKDAVPPEVLHPPEQE